MRRFNTIGSVSYDHPDPSIFLVLQSPSDMPGGDTIDFVIFPPRWLAAEDTFHSPWFHRNVASEFMGLVLGGASLHNCMSGHGPDADTFDKASNSDTSKPAKVGDTMAFMFETRTLLKPTSSRSKPNSCRRTTTRAGRASPNTSIRSNHERDALDATLAPSLKSWIESANDPANDFPIQNLPFGIFSDEIDAQPRAGVASATGSSTCPCSSAPA